MTALAPAAWKSPVTNLCEVFMKFIQFPTLASPSFVYTQTDRQTHR
jgi:hypothetical protein